MCAHDVAVFATDINEGYIMEIDIETAFFLIHVGVPFIAILGLLGLIAFMRGTPMQRDIRRQLRAHRKRVRKYARERAKYRRERARRLARI